MGSSTLISPMLGFIWIGRRFCLSDLGISVCSFTTTDWVSQVNVIDRNWVLNIFKFERTGKFCIEG